MLYINFCILKAELLWITFPAMLSAFLQKIFKEKVGTGYVWAQLMMPQKGSVYVPYRCY